MARSSASVVTGLLGLIGVVRIRSAMQSRYCQGIAGIKSYTKYNHTGWVKHEGADYYLHCGGAIGKDGATRTAETGFVVDLGGALPLYALPDPPTGSQLTNDVQATLHLRNLGWTGRPNARGIAAALVALPWRAVLGACNFAVVLAGGSGGGKTSLGCLVTQHFAPDTPTTRIPRHRSLGKRPSPTSSGSPTPPKTQSW